MWINQKFFKYLTATLLVMLAIFMLNKIGFLFSPFIAFISTILAPVLAVGISYYIVRPLVQLLQKLRLTKVPAILLSYVIIIALLVILSTYTGSIIASQFNSLISPRNLDLAQNAINDIISNNQWLSSLPIQDLSQKASEYMETITRSLTSTVFNVVSMATSIGAVVILVPILLFYFLKDDHLVSSKLLKIIPKRHKNNIREILEDIDTALSSYIIGQMTVALTIGIFMFIGYMIIGMDYSLVLAIFAMVTSIIPFFGCWIGIIPAVLVGLTMNPFMLLKVLILMIVVQQVDGNFISPQIMRKSLDIHPVTVILLLMGAVAIYGFVGLLLVIPAYAAIKVTVKNIYRMYFARRVENFMEKV